MHIVLRIERRAGGGGLGLECISLHITGNYYYWSRLEGVGGGRGETVCWGRAPNMAAPSYPKYTHVHPPFYCLCYLTGTRLLSHSFQTQFVPSIGRIRFYLALSFSLFSIKIINLFNKKINSGKKVKYNK